MAMTKLRAIPVLNVKQIDKNNYQFSTNDGKTYSIDLGKTPDWARTNAAQDWKDIKADDHVRTKTGGATTIPDAPPSTQGVLYATDEYCTSANPPILYPDQYFPKFPNYDKYASRRYEFESVVYSPDDADETMRDRRFFGFFGAFLSGDDSSCQIAVAPAGSSYETNYVVTTDFNLLDHRQCHPLGQGLTTLSKREPFGPIFLPCEVATSLKLGLPKLPTVLGSVMLPFCRGAE